MRKDWSPRSLAVLFLVLMVWLAIHSCASPKPIPEPRPQIDPFSRIYPVPFGDFHPKVNQALQSFAKMNPGNTFQVVRLGSNAVIIRGFYQKGKGHPRLPVELTTRPAGPMKTHLQIQISAFSLFESHEGQAAELFQIIEKETGLPAFE